MIIIKRVRIYGKNGKLLFVLVIIVLCIPLVGAAPLPNNRHIFINVANDAGVRFNFDGPAYGGPSNTYYIKADGGGLNELHITNSLDDIAGQVTTSPDQQGTFFISNTGGRGWDDNLILLIAVNGTISDDFNVRIKSSGYRWTPCPAGTSVPTGYLPSDYTFVTGAVDQTFTKADFIYGPQIWKPGPGTLGVMNMPLYYGQNMANSANTFQLLFVDLGVGNMYPSSFPGATLTNKGAAKVEYSFNHLTTFAAFDGYGWCNASNQGQGISWTNDVSGGGTSGVNGFSVIGVSALVPIPLPGYTNPPTDPDGDGIFEDLNANGRKDFNDVFVFFKQMSWIGSNEPVLLFDFNGNARIDFNDIFLMFKEI